jgi:hypothetical protein
MGAHDPFGHLTHKLWPKERLGVKLTILNQDQINLSAFTNAQTSLVFVYGTQGKLMQKFDAF